MMKTLYNFKENKYSTIYMLSFLWLIPLIYAAPYVTARLWADMILYAAIALLVYDLSYLFFFRRKEGVSFGRALARAFLYFQLVILIIFANDYLQLFFSGYTPSDLWGNSTGPTVYGFKAIRSDGWGNLIRIPVMIIAAVYITLYAIISRLKKK